MRPRAPGCGLSGGMDPRRTYGRIALAFEGLCFRTVATAAGLDPTTPSFEG